MRKVFAALLLIGWTCAPLSAADPLPSTKQGPASAHADDLKSQPRWGRAARYTIDSARTVVSFEVRSFGIFRQQGWFGTSSGCVWLDPQADEGTFDVVIDARTVQAGSDARLRIMRGAGFLNVEKFPEISYKAEHVIFNAGEPIRVEGELTLLGVTHAVTLRVSGYHCTPLVDADLRRCVMNATAIFRRSEFGMTSSMPLAGNRIRLLIHAEATADPGDERSRVRGHAAGCRK
jgi:polyisoprenoid-binding protein YceI